MVTQETEELGPIDFVLIEFPAGRADFTKGVADELAILTEVELIRVLDVLIIEKHEDGDVEAMEFGDLPELGRLRGIEAELAEVLSQEDVEHLAAAMEPGTVAAAIIWENTWAAPFGTAVRAAGGQVIADGRLPMQAIVAALEADSK